MTGSMESKADNNDQMIDTYITIDIDELEQSPVIDEKDNECIESQPTIECTDRDAKTRSLISDSQQIDDVLGEYGIKRHSLKCKYSM